MAGPTSADFLWPLFLALIGLGQEGLDNEKQVQRVGEGDVGQGILLANELNYLGKAKCK